MICNTQIFLSVKLNFTFFNHHLRIILSLLFIYSTTLYYSYSCVIPKSAQSVYSDQSKKLVHSVSCISLLPLFLLFSHINSCSSFNIKREKWNTLDDLANIWAKLFLSQLSPNKIMTCHWIMYFHVTKTSNLNSLRQITIL